MFGKSTPVERTSNWKAGLLKVWDIKRNGQADTIQTYPDQTKSDLQTELPVFCRSTLQIYKSIQEQAEKPVVAASQESQGDVWRISLFKIKRLWQLLPSLHRNLDAFQAGHDPEGGSEFRCGNAGFVRILHGVLLAFIFRSQMYSDSDI